jgi:hypothetical protein
MVVRAVKIYRAVLLYGESGAGKSSLVNAGLIPEMLTRRFIPERIRVSPVPGGELIVERLAADPHGNSFLPSNLMEDPPSERLVLSAEAFVDRLGKLPAETRPLLIFDQFEEFVTLFEEVPRGDELRKARQAEERLLAMLAALLREAPEGKAPLKLLFVFREDYLAKLQKVLVLYPKLTDQAVRLTPPRTEALPEIVRGPFEHYPGKFRNELPEAVTTALIRELTERSVGELLNPSEVQVACRELWESPDPAQVLADRHVEGLLEDYMVDALRALPPDQQDAATSLLRHLVTASGARNVVSEDDLISNAQLDVGAPEALLRQALHALENEARLVRRELRRNVAYYEIISEFLVKYIARLRAQRLEQRLAEQAERHRQEQESARRLLHLEKAARQAEAERAQQSAETARLEAARRLEGERVTRLQHEKRVASRLMWAALAVAGVLLALGVELYRQREVLRRQSAELSLKDSLLTVARDSLQDYNEALKTQMGDSARALTTQRAAVQDRDSVARAALARADSLRLAGASNSQQIASLRKALEDEQRARLSADSVRKTVEGALLRSTREIAELRDSVAKLNRARGAGALSSLSHGTLEVAHRSEPDGKGADGRPLWAWRMFLIGDEKALDAVRCVAYILHPTFPQPVQSVCVRGEEPAEAFPFDAKAWGSFQAIAFVLFKDGTNQTLEHVVLLTP